MTPSRTLHIVIEPREPRLLANGSPNPTQRAFDEYDRFAEELRVETSGPVEIIECALHEAPADGILLVAYRPTMREPFMTRRPSVPDPSRLLLINISVEDATMIAEPLRPAGMILNERYRRWVLSQERPILTQMYGPRELAPDLAPLLTPYSLAETEHFCTYRSKEPLALPFVLARYINAYWNHIHSGK